MLMLNMTQTICMDPPTNDLPIDMWNKIIAGSENTEKNTLATCNKLLRFLCTKNNHSLYIHTPLLLSQQQKNYALLCATYHGNAQAVKNLLMIGANPHHSTIYLTLLPFSWAFRKKNIALLELFNEHDRKNKHNYHYSKIIPRLYSIAVYLGDLPTLQACAQLESYKPHYNNTYGNSLLHSAVFNGHYHIIEWLLQDNMIRTIVPYWGWEGKNALLMATEKKYGSIVELLLGISTTQVNDRSQKGITPLHVAVIRQYHNIVKSLLKHPDIDVNIQLQNGYTPLHIATENKDIKMIRILVASNKINFYIVNSTNESVFDLANALGNDKVLQILREGAKKSFIATKVALWQNK